MAENKLILDRHLLVCSHGEVPPQRASECEYLVTHFCGQVLHLSENDPEILQRLAPLAGRSIYVCGDVARFRRAIHIAKVEIQLVRELCINLSGDSEVLAWVGLGEVSGPPLEGEHLDKVLAGATIMDRLTKSWR